MWASSLHPSEYPKWLQLHVRLHRMYSAEQHGPTQPLCRTVRSADKVPFLERCRATLPGPIGGNLGACQGCAPPTSGAAPTSLDDEGPRPQANAGALRAEPRGRAPKPSAEVRSARAAKRVGEADRSRGGSRAAFQRTRNVDIQAA